MELKDKKKKNCSYFDLIISIFFNDYFTCIGCIWICVCFRYVFKILLQGGGDVEAGDIDEGEVAKLYKMLLKMGTFTCSAYLVSIVIMYIQ